MRFYKTLALLNGTPWNNKDQPNLNTLNFNKIIINLFILHALTKKIIHPSDWKQALHKEILFPTSFQVILYNHSCFYNYWDYQHAWFNTFFLQNSKGSYSWLFYFNNSINILKLPSWFCQWLDYFDPLYDLFQPII
jgi:hypothetical protein